MLANIVGFDMRIELLEGKFKLGQERPEADRQGILKYLQTARRGAIAARSHGKFLSLTKLLGVLHPGSRGEML